MNIVTFKNIINAFEDVVNQQLAIYPQHTELKTFGWGDLSDINTINIEGILMYVVPLATELVETNLSKYKMDIYFLDVLDVNVDNRLQLLEDTILVGTDIMKKMGGNTFRKNYSFNVKPASDFSIVNMEFEQRCLGWVISVTIVCYNGSTCNINM